MNRLQIKETNQALIRELKTRIISKEISNRELTDLTSSLKCPQCGEIQKEVKEIKQLLILVIGGQKKSSEVNIPWLDEKKLLKEYQEAWSDPQRFAEFKQWEQAAINDWTERARAKKIK